MPREIYITQTDRERLNRLIDEALYGGAQPGKSYRELRRELERASVVEPSELPSNVVSMRTRALVSLDGEEEEISLVYPEEADWTKGKLSVLSPVGMALLGYREGDQFDWEVVDGKTHIEIRKILYQPEASGDFEL